MSSLAILTSVLNSLPGKLNIKRCEPGILLSGFKLADSLFKLAIMKYYRCLCHVNVIDYVIQKLQRHHDLIKAHAVR